MLHHIFISTIYENFKWLFSTYLGQICMPVWSEQLKELKQSWGTFTE